MPDLKPFVPFILLALGFFSLLAVILTVYDKIASKKFPRSRVPEAVLLLTAALGGSVAMFITMKIIRHKTKHKKFMIGLPVIIIAQIAIGITITLRGTF